MRKQINARGFCGMVEQLESRRLFSGVVGSSVVPTPGVGSNTTSSKVILAGTTINAEANQAFRAVVGTINNLSAPPKGYTLKATISWGDSNVTTAGQLVSAGTGAIDVVGSHTYLKAGSDAITVTVTEVPPAGSTAPVIVVGTINSKANVITPNGGVTLSEMAGVAFTANMGTFHSTALKSQMTAVISWGDGTQSNGTIVALPTTGIVPSFSVFGTHTYSGTGSYAVHVTIYTPSTLANAGLNVIAQFDSVVDALPMLLTAAL